MGSVPLMLRLPDDEDGVLLPLLAESQDTGETVQAIILRIVSEHYGVTDTPPSRGRPANPPDGD
jgi:hypothetical protein